MKSKGYVKTIEDENYTLRQRVDELDVKIGELHKVVDDIPYQINMTMHHCFTDGLDNFFTETASIYTNEDDAICDICMSICRMEEIVDPVWRRWRQDKLEKCMNIKLRPKWTIEYWYLGMRFLKVHFTLHKKKRNFVKIFISDYDRTKNFKYTEEEDVDRMAPYIKRTPVYYKKKLYSYINETAHKHKFTPYK